MLSALCFAALACSGGARASRRGRRLRRQPAPRQRAGSTIKIAMIAKSSTNPVFLAARTGAEAAAKELSEKNGIKVEVDVAHAAAGGRPGAGAAHPQAVNEGADAILISCSDAGKVTGAINDAVDRGVPVMTFDSDAPQSKRFAFYGVDDLKTGQHDDGGAGEADGRQGQGRHPRRQPERAQPAEARAGRARGGGEVSRASRSSASFNHIETPQDAAAEVDPRQQRVSRDQRLGDDRRLAALHARRCSPSSIPKR